ncbi:MULTISPECIES: hypothetical protein [Streptomyces]|uniref:hypothetical protein n=1 Tax=Streptomyces TaxID=1883 RepID=UPI0004CAF13B|nr:MULTISPECIES: hypothetical protein [Streptomyces]AQT70846.1 hypothetical protein B1K54_03175 [Streptomyces sp. fd1-xmd]MDX6760417.1 hypothetical protein [Streptomyces sp. F8]
MTDTSTDDEQVYADLRALTDQYMQAVRARLAEVESPLTRERGARLVTDDMLTGAKAAKLIRSAAMGELKQGRTLKQVAELTGLSVPRVDQLLKAQ